MHHRHSAAIILIKITFKRDVQNNIIFYGNINLEINNTENEQVTIYINRMEYLQHLINKTIEVISH